MQKHWLSLRRLTLKLRLYVGVPDYCDSDFDMGNIEELVVIQDEDVPDRFFQSDIFYILNRHKFPKLRSLEVKYVRTYLKSLDKFVQAHLDTLRCLRVYKPRMSKEQWIQVWLRYSGKRKPDRIFLTEPTVAVVCFCQPRGGVSYREVAQRLGGVALEA